MSENPPAFHPNETPEEENGKLVSEITIPSEPGNERLAIDRVVQAVFHLNLPDDVIQRLITAVGEATMNAMEHGNQYRADYPVIIQIYASEQSLAVHVSDEGGDVQIPTPAIPDLEAKLAGLQSPRGWGLFLIQNMVDEMRVRTDKNHHTVELIFHVK